MHTLYSAYNSIGLNTQTFTLSLSGHLKPVGGEVGPSWPIVYKFDVVRGVPYILIHIPLYILEKISPYPVCHTASG